MNLFKKKKNKIESSNMKLTFWMNDFSCAMYTGNSTFRKEQVMKPFFFMLKGSYYIHVKT